MFSDYLILLTACVTPSYDVTRRDPIVRLEDYKRGLRFWLNSPFDKIVFAENSSHPLESFQVIASEYNKQVEFVSVPPREKIHYHYGYDELRMVDHVVEGSHLLKESKYFIKATGRLTFPKITRLIKRLPEDYLFAVDGRTFKVRPSITTPLMIFSTEFYRNHLLGREQELASISGYIENSLHDALINFRDEPGAILRWPVNCNPSGIPAHWHKTKSYDSIRQRAMQTARALSRIVAPNWWI